jgi:DNA-3-methyladenine glycosylase
VKRLDLEGPPDEVARALLGSFLATKDVVARIVDVEAYGAADDEASHAYRGQRMANRSMFGPAGHLYVYVSYGIHRCANVVCRPEGEAAAVLVRGAVVVEGVAAASARRGRALIAGRLDGPGRLCQGLGIELGSDGCDLLEEDSPVRLLPGALEPAEHVVAAPRIGLTKEVDRPWRFAVFAHSSRPRPSR